MVTTSLVSVVAQMHMRRELYCDSSPNTSLTYFLLHKLTWLNFLPLLSLLTLHFERNFENSAVIDTERKRRYRKKKKIQNATKYESIIMEEIETKFYSCSVFLWTFFLNYK